jgi:1-acyl-sn-glycerol-3-phosphate acyltransferase
MTTTYRVPFRIKVNRAVLRPFFRGLFHFLGRVKITGLKNVPPKGPYMAVINHVSIFEAPLVISFWPQTLEVAGAAVIWERRGQATLARLYGGIQVHRGQYDRQMIEVVLSVLEAGYPLMLSPEGGRSLELGMRRAKPGVAYIIDKAQVPVVPVGVVGSTVDWLEKALRWEQPEIEMRVGRPFKLPTLVGRGASRRMARQGNADLVMAHIAALLPPEYRGVYSHYADILDQTAN